KVFGNAASDEETFLAPYIPQLNKFYNRHSPLYGNIRVETNGLGFIIWQRDNYLHLGTIKIKELIKEIFRLHGMHMVPSNAGIKIFRLIKQLGGLQNCKIFKVKGVRDLIEKYGPNKSFTKSNAVLAI